jgi:hypothetical protein
MNVHTDYTACTESRKAGQQEHKGKDTNDYETMLPTIENIECEIDDFIDADGYYCNCWGITDNYNSDNPICLKLGIDFVEME